MDRKNLSTIKECNESDGLVIRRKSRPVDNEVVIKDSDPFFG